MFTGQQINIRKLKKITHTDWSFSASDKCKKKNTKTRQCFHKSVLK